MEEPVRKGPDLDQMMAWREEPMEPWALRLIDQLFASRGPGAGAGNRGQGE